jgi:hypothetical protein
MDLEQQAAVSDHPIQGLVAFCFLVITVLFVF